VRWAVGRTWEPRRRTPSMLWDGISFTDKERERTYSKVKAKEERAVAVEGEVWRVRWIRG